MKDKYNREIDYLRISVTENCNLNCIYCNGNKSNEVDCKSRLLSIDEIVTVTKRLAELGITKVRLTGGEPLVRKDIVEIVYKLKQLNKIKELSLTSNGVLFNQYAEDLKSAGLDRINISLDSLSFKKVIQLCGKNTLDTVISGIEKAKSIGISPVKLNTVLIKGYNEMEFLDFVDFSEKYEIDVRFIELMPMSGYGEENKDKIVFNKDLIEKYKELKLLNQEENSGPAVYYRYGNKKGRIGFISPISQCFCENCNRIRLTSDGKIRLCLGNNEEIDIRNKIYDKKGELQKVLSEAIFQKPKYHSFRDDFLSDRKMGRLGG